MWNLHKLCCLVFTLILLIGLSDQSPIFGNLFGRPRSRRYRNNNYGRSYNDGGSQRYKSICRAHAGMNLAFPGRIGNPVCPW